MNPFAAEQLITRISDGVAVALGVEPQWYGRKESGFHWCAFRALQSINVKVYGPGPTGAHTKVWVWTPVAIENAPDAKLAEKCAEANLDGFPSCFLFDEEHQMMNLSATISYQEGLDGGPISDSQLESLVERTVLVTHAVAELQLVLVEWIFDDLEESTEEKIRLARVGLPGKGLRPEPHPLFDRFWELPGLSEERRSEMGSAFAALKQHSEEAGHSVIVDDRSFTTQIPLFGRHTGKVQPEAFGTVHLELTENEYWGTGATCEALLPVAPVSPEEANEMNSLEFCWSAPLSHIGAWGPHPKGAIHKCFIPDFALDRVGPVFLAIEAHNRLMQWWFFRTLGGSVWLEDNAAGFLQ